MFDYTIINKLKESVQNSHSDYSTEILASALLNNGIYESQLVFQAMGGSKRSYRKDISTFNIIENKEELLFMYANRDGIYDGLPEFIFHSHINNYNTINTLDVIEAMHRFRQEEKHARLFFLPFEQEFFKLKILIQQVSEEFDHPILNQKKSDLLTGCWPIFNSIDKISGYLFLCLLPHIYSFRNDLKKVEKCLSIIINVPVHITLQASSINNTTISPNLEDMELGINSIIGNIAYDGETDLYIEIGPMPNDVHKDFQHKGSKHGIIEKLCDFFIGANYFITIKYICEKPEEACSLNEEESVLGFNTFL